MKSYRPPGVSIYLCLPLSDLVSVGLYINGEAIEIIPVALCVRLSGVHLSVDWATGSTNVHCRFVVWSLFLFSIYLFGRLFGSTVYGS